MKNLQRGLKKGEKFTDGGRVFVVDEVLDGNRYISHVVAEEVKNKASEKELKELDVITSEEEKETLEEKIELPEENEEVIEEEVLEEKLEENTEEVLEEEASKESVEEKVVNRDDSSKLDQKDYEQLSKNELLELCEKIGIEANTKMKKTEIIEMLVNMPE